MISYRKLAMRVLGHSPVSAVKTARRRSTGKRAAALALTAALVVGMTLPAFAQDWYIDAGDISISAGENGNNVTQNGETTEDTDTVIKSKGSSSNTVTIHADEGKTVNVTLDNVNIDTSETGKAAVSVTGSGNTNIELNGNNTLTSGGWHAGLEHNKETDSEGNETSGTLTITDTDKNGSLTATGHFGGAGIGGGNIKNAGKIEITGGTITAVGAEDGAGIGGGGGGGIGGDADITISGGTITAIGGQPENIAGIGGAGIGGGGLGGSADITITGDAVIKEAIGGNGAAGIGSGMGNPWTSEPLITVGNVTIEGNAKVDSAVGGANGAAGIGGGTLGIGNVTIRGNAQIGNATGGDEGAGIGGGVLGTGDVTIEGNVTIENAKGGAGAAGIGGGAETQPDTEDTKNKVSIKSTEAGSPNITATGGGAYKDDYVSLPGAAAIGSGSVVDGATEVKSDITVEGKVTINATSGGDVAIGDSTNGETRFSGLQVGTKIIRRNAKGDDVSQPGDVPEPEKPAQPTVTPTETEAAEAPSTGSVEAERPVTVEGLYVTNVLGKQITHTCTQNGTTLTIRANGIVTSAHLTLGMVRTLKAQGVKTLVFTTLLSRSTTVSVDALLAAEPDAPDETAVVWTHTGPRAALTIDGTDHSALLK